MKDVQDIQQEVNRALSERRSAAARLSSMRFQEVCGRIPEYREKDEQIKRLGVKLGRLALFGKIGTEEYVETKEALEALSGERVALLEKNGYKANYFDDVFTCPFCSDTGVVSKDGYGAVCSCYMRLYTGLLQKESNMVYDKGLESFKLEKYNEFPDDDNAASPYENAERALNKAKSFVNNFGTDTVNNMLIIGGTGVGKTHLCGCIAYELTGRGVPVLYMSAAELFDTLTYFGDDDVKRARREQLEKILYSVELLIIDDLGSEKQSAARYNILIEILNQRSGNKGSRRKTIVSSNLSLEALKSQYDERIYSRLSAFDICELTGSDNRVRK